MALVNPDCIGDLSISGVSLNTPAWMTLNLERLWYQPDVRGEDRLVPGVTGVIPYRRRITSTTYELEFFIVGDCDQAGTPHADGLLGLQANLEYLWVNVFTPLAAHPGTRPASLILPSGSTRTANVHVQFSEGIVRVINNTICGQTRSAGMTGLITMTVPTGLFV